MEQYRPQDLLKLYQFRHKRRLGQNFLHDPGLLQKITVDAAVNPGDWVFEIGPGLGALTAALAAAGAYVTALEVDRELVAILNKHLQLDRVNIVQADALKADWDAVLRQSGWQQQPLKLVANLPYYITSPLIMKALAGPLPFLSLTVMVQREVAQRMQAAPGSKDYGILSVAVQYYCEPTVMRVIPAAAFYPKPQVDSAVVHLQVRNRRQCPEREQLFFAAVRAGFSQRRKTLRNTLKQLPQAKQLGPAGLEALLINAGIDPGSRAESLSLQQFLDLAAALSTV